MKTYKPPFDIQTINSEGKAITIRCEKSLRSIPGRRVACIGSYQGKPAFIKVFFHSFKAQRHWERESRGIQILLENSIATPELLFAGKETNGGGRIIVQQLKPDSIDLLGEWKKDRQQAFKYIKKIIALLVKMHLSGICQQDIHPDNFLLVDDETYCIDVAMLTKSENPLIATEACKNIALFAAQFPPSDEEFEKEIWQQYCLQREEDWYEKYLSEYLQDIAGCRLTRAENLLAKLYRRSSNYIFHKNSKKHFCINKSWYESDKKGKLNNLDKLFSGKNINYLKQGGSSTVIKIALNDKEIVIKRYNIKNFLHGMKRAFRRTRASRSWAMSHLLQIYGIDTPTPIAFFENRIGPIRRTSYFICEFMPGPNLLDYFTGETKLSGEKKYIADQAITLLEKLGKAGIYHGDMKATNLIVNNKKIYLLDLDAVSWYQSAARFKPYHQKDLKRFLRNWQQDSEIYQYFSSALKPVNII